MTSFEGGSYFCNMIARKFSLLEYIHCLHIYLWHSTLQVMPSFANSLASNVEASLSFTLATKLVSAMLSLKQQPWILASMLFIILSVAGNGENIMVQVLLLALSRLVILQVPLCNNFDCSIPPPHMQT